MLQDIRRLTELYLHAKGFLPDGMSWQTHHSRAAKDANLEDLRLLVDADVPAKYWLFINVDTAKKTCEVADAVEAGQISEEERYKHLFWQGSGGRQSDNIRSTPHKLFNKKKDFSVEKVIAPLKSIRDRYCMEKVEKGKSQRKRKVMGPLFWDPRKIEETRRLSSLIQLIQRQQKQITKTVTGTGKQGGKFPPLKPSESVLVALKIDGKQIGKYELFRRYLTFVRLRKGTQGGPEAFEGRVPSEVTSNMEGLCPSCKQTTPLLSQWHERAELSFYQLTDAFHSSYSHPSSTYKLCQACADLLFVFKQHLLETMSKQVGGNECLILPSIKLLPTEDKELRHLYQTLEAIWTSPAGQVKAGEERLLYRLAQLPSYATVSFVFGDAVSTGKTKDVKRLDALNVVFPDVLPSRLTQVTEAVKQANERLAEIWGLAHIEGTCPWSIRGDFSVLAHIFHPAWEEKKKSKSRRRTEMERYLRAIFYGDKVSPVEVANDCQGNLVAAYKKSRKREQDDDKYTLSNYMGRLLSLYVFLDVLEGNMSSQSANEFQFTRMPELEQFIARHPLLRDGRFAAPFLVGCLFSYAEYLQRPNTRLAAYNWLGTLALTYDDILQNIYPKSLEYIKNKVKIIESYRLQELMKAICHYDQGRCDDDRAATVAFCHGWAMGRDFILKKSAKKEGQTDGNASQDK